MNYFAHAYRFLDDPCFVAGTGVPDWLTVADRAVRVRAKQVLPAVEHPDAAVAAVARGMLQHFRDDARFHETPDFAQAMAAIGMLARKVLGGDSSVRPGFLGHLLVELLLDASLIAGTPARLEEYYHLLDRVDVGMVQDVVNLLAPRPTVRLAGMIFAFRQARILWDYLDDAKLMVRLNQVMRRVGLAPLPACFQEILPETRKIVEDRREGLLGAVLAAQRGTGSE